MSGLDKILGHISEQSQAEADKIIALANDEAADILKAAKEECDEIKKTAKAKSELDVAEYKKRADSSAQLQQKKAILNEKQKIINDVIMEAKEYLDKLNDNDYFAFLLKMAEKFVLAQEGEIALSEKDMKRLPGDFIAKVQKIAKDKNGNLKLSKKAADIDSGFVLIYGGVEENCSFESLFDAAKESLQDKVGALLF